MPVNTRSSSVSFALKTLASAVACALFFSPAANAAGLGKLTVLSSLGQPLRAEIELTAVSADEAGALVAKLAPADAFRVANIDFNPTLLSLHFDVEQRGGRQVIRITSGQPVNEPFVDMLLELNWTGGRLVREYTFLLDPAEMRSTQSAQVAAPVDLQNRNAAPASAPTATQAPTPAAAPLPPPVAARPSRAPADAPVRPQQQAQQSQQQQYQVKQGDTLGRIAGQLKPTDISLDMMLVALYRANPEAFVGNNMNRLKSGQILSVPDSDAIRASGSDTEAHGVVVAHAADFSAYRSKLAGQVAQSAPAKDAEPARQAGGKITAKVEEHATPANAAKDQLKLSKAAPSASANGQAVVAVEDKIAKEKQMAEAASRVKELEKNVSDLEKLMAVKSKAAVDQKKASASAAASVPVIALDASATAAAVPAPKHVAPPPPARIAEPGLVDTLMDNITYVGVALAALLAGAGLIVSRRRKQMVLPRAETSVLGDPGTQAHSMFAHTGGQSVDTNNSVFNSNFAPSASQLDTNEVDPVAEADVYIAYGRDAQAEEILKEALRTHPERHPVRLKLLEIYATRKDVRAFETQASELYALTKGQGEEWAQASAMGLSIDPLNPLFSGAPAHDAGAASHLAAEAAAGVGLAAVGAAAFAAEHEATHTEDLGFESEPAAADNGGLDLDLSQDAAPATDDPGMDFGFDDDMKTALPEVPTPAAMADADAEHFLDFDLGGLNIEETPVAAAPYAAPADAGLDMDFDAPATAAPPAEAKPVAPAAAPADEPDFSMDFGLDLPDDVTTATATAEAPRQPPRLTGDPLDDLNMMDFDIPAVPAPAAAPTADELSLDDDFGLTDLPPPAAPAKPAAGELALDPDFGLPELPPAQAVASESALPEFDLSGIDLDLDMQKAASGAPAHVSEEELSALHMEMDTKLDLAIAYQEIGDKEGARELLDEVLRGGSDDQIAKAHTMRAQLA
ncbi:FimV/HubP family polar landmark protein [Rugamonas sp.]|uniref:FimV/HubP family polar landmark protein n=1 Tax=Rugamonas sp. TaxID=1926287 RepID=UPI0025E588A3|nr:FimV/HubP family polar landmark protein [Rugamonas sp.]